MNNNAIGCCGICKVCFYSTCQCCGCIDQPPQPQVFETLCLGITNAGKSTLLSVLLHENTDTIVPTVGFNVKDLKVNNCLLNVKELGGGENIRQYWDRYYSGVQAVVFVIDGLCTHTELEETRKELYKALKNPQLQVVPWLILCNKQDVEGASTHQKVIEELHLNEVISDNPNILVKSSSKTNRQALIDSFELFASVVERFYENVRDDDRNRA